MNYQNKWDNKKEYKCDSCGEYFKGEFIEGNGKFLNCWTCLESQQVEAQYELNRTKGIE